MSETKNNQYLPKIRIVNFSTIFLESDNVLPISELNANDLPGDLRKYADLPHVYVVSAGQEERILNLLARLKEIRSSCYPYGLFVSSGDYSALENSELDVVELETSFPADVSASINKYIQKRFNFDKKQLKYQNNSSLPESVDVVIIGGGITGLYAAKRFAEKEISFCVLEKREIVGGIWSKYANTTSMVNTSEGAYRLFEKKSRSNRDHSSTREILEDLQLLASDISEHIYTESEVERFEHIDGGYETRVLRDKEIVTIRSKGLILAINDRVGIPREISWPDQEKYHGRVFSGISDDNLGVDWQGKKVVIVGMGAFAIENVRTALENGAEHVTVVCRRHGTVCPKIIDYLNFATPYDETFQHDRKSNIRNMMLWKKLYDLAGATQPECWMGKIKHEGHTISVSDIWFIGHHLKKLQTITGSIISFYEEGVVIDNGLRIEADLIVNCVGFHRMSPVVKQMSDYSEMFNNNYIDKDLMYLADAYIDDDVFNSFFGSSVLEMTKFYMDVYLDFFDNPEFEAMMQTSGIEKISIEDRSWSQYIAGADAIIARYQRFYEAAKTQIEKRTENFLEAHDLDIYIAQNKREWIAIHQLLTGRKMQESECLPYVFDKLLAKKAG